MKKLLLGITILAFVLVATSAMAAGPKVPKSLCLDYASYTDYHQLAIKSIGTVQTAGGTVKMYTISGFAGIFNHPISGSGYVAPGTTILHATFSGKNGLASHRLRFYDLFFDLGTNSGTIYYTHTYADATAPTTGSDTVVSTDCLALSIPSAMATSGANTSDDQ